MSSTPEEIFQLWGRVQNGDKEAKRELLRLHNERFPHHQSWAKMDTMDARSWHTVYLQLYR